METAAWTTAALTAATVTFTQIRHRTARVIRDAVWQGHEVAYVEVVTYDPATGRAHTHTIDTKGRF